MSDDQLYRKYLSDDAAAGDHLMLCYGKMYLYEVIEIIKRNRQPA